MTAEISVWEKELDTVLQQFQEQAYLTQGDLLVIGCSTSEVIGEKIGTAGTFEVAEMIFGRLADFSKKNGLQLAFQCCEHLNRALVVERQTAIERGLEEVTVIPVRTAGGAMATYAYGHLQNPAVVEFLKADAGIDIGHTLMGMHLKHVAVPIRTVQKTVGHAHVTLAKTRPKLIGGARAVYERTPENEKC